MKTLEQTVRTVCNDLPRPASSRRFVSSRAGTSATDSLTGRPMMERKRSSLAPRAMKGDFVSMEYWILVVGVFGGFGYALWRLYARRPATAVNTTTAAGVGAEGPSGLGGWLILIVLGQARLILNGLWTVFTCVGTSARKPQ